MTVFHGSVCEVRCPDLSRSKRYIDFGPGFYVTDIQRQAERWARRKAARFGGKAIVSTYSLNEDWLGYRVKTFPEASKEWLDFVCDCRNGLTPYLSYDIISGKVANDRVFQAIDMYRRGIWDENRTLQEITYYEDSSQIAINGTVSLKPAESTKDPKPFSPKDLFYDKTPEMADVFNGH